MTLATIDPMLCPTCSAPLRVTRADELPLLCHGGYGAARRRSWRTCPGCGYVLANETSEVKP